MADFGLALQGRGLRQGARIAGHARLHEPRAGPGRGAPGRRPLGHLQPGRRLLRAARPAAGRSGASRISEVLDQIANGRAAPAPADRRHDPPGAGADLPEGAGQAGVGAVQHGPGPGRGPAALSPDRDGVSGSADHGPRHGQPAARLDPGGHADPAIGPTPTDRPSRSSPRGCGRSTSTTPTSSSSSCPARATATACPRASGSGRPGSRSTDPDTTSGSA